VNTKWLGRLILESFPTEQQARGTIKDGSIKDKNLEGKNIERTLTETMAAKTDEGGAEH